MKTKRNKQGRVLCLHGRQRHVCKDCGGVSSCDHSNRRATCRLCGGSQICEHGRMRSTCRPCGGASICEHSRMRFQCKECNPLGRYQVYVRNARARGQRFELSFEEYQGLVCQPCTYCDVHDETNGIDQIQPGGGYPLANCVPCCSKCNYMKKNYSVDEFLQHARRIAVFQSTKK